MKTIKIIIPFPKYVQKLENGLYKYWNENAQPKIGIKNILNSLISK